MTHSLCHLGSRARRPGYVLLLVLFVIALATVAMASVCRMSFEKALHANRAEADLKRRWAVNSCRAVLLPRAEAILTHAPAPTAQVRREIHLSGQSFTLIFADEQAKANVNLLYAQGQLSGAERDVRAIIQASGGGIPVELRPIPGRGKNFGTPDADDEDPPAFESFGQVFGRTPPQLLITPQGQLPPPTAGLTCWGDGSLNFRRASVESARAFLGSSRFPSAQISQLLELRSRNPDMETSDLLDLLNLPETRRDAIEERLTDDSSCHSLWIISDSGTRKWYDLAVSDNTGSPILFSW